MSSCNKSVRILSGTAPAAACSLWIYLTAVEVKTSRRDGLSAFIACSGRFACTHKHHQYVSRRFLQTCFVSKLGKILNAHARITDGLSRMKSALEILHRVVDLIPDMSRIRQYLEIGNTLGRSGDRDRRSRSRFRYLYPRNPPRRYPVHSMHTCNKPLSFPRSSAHTTAVPITSPPNTHINRFRVQYTTACVR